MNLLLMILYLGSSAANRSISSDVWRKQDASLSNVLKFEFYFGRLQKFDIVAIEHQIGHERIENEIIQLSSTECHEQGSSLFERKRHVEFDMFHTY